ncbi:hypothetical protein D3C84_1175790 [compost metagenome]
MVINAGKFSDLDGVELELVEHQHAGGLRGLITLAVGQHYRLAKHVITRQCQRPTRTKTTVSTIERIELQLNRQRWTVQRTGLYLAQR